MFLVCHIFLSIALLSLGCASIKEKISPSEKLEIPSKKVEKTAQRPPITFEKQEIKGAEAAKEKTIPPEILKLPEFKTRVSEKVLPPSRPIDTKRITLARDPVMINVERMPLSDFIIHALGETLKVSFVMDQRVMESKEPINMRMTEPIPSEKALEIVLGLFDRYNLYVEERAGALYILHKSPETKQPLDLRIGREAPESPAPILLVAPLRYIRPAEIEALLKEFYKTGVQIRPYPRENVILFYGQASQVKQLIDFVETFDVPYMVGKKMIMFKLVYWQIDEFVRQLSQVFESLGIPIAKTSRDPGIQIVPIKTLGTLLIIAPDDTSLNYVLEWKEKLDTPDAAGTEERPFIYTPRYSKSSDLVKSIKTLYEIIPTPQPTTTPAPTPTAPAPTAPAPATPARAPASSPALTRPGLKISSDDHRNVVLVFCSPVEYRNILTLLMEIDKPPRQVLIEAMIAELTLKDELKYGIEWYLRDSLFGGSLKGTFQLESLFGLTRGPGLVYQFVTDTGKFRTLINAFAAEDKVRILSTPRLMVLDNQEATIQVGTDIPIVTGEVTASDVSQAQPSILRNIQYRNTGVILRVKPTINTEGLLTLNISQEVSEMGTNPPGINSPTVLMRKINTSVVAAHGESIALGGLMSESLGDTENKIPLLGDIPLLGTLFKTTSKENRKTELLILLTPMILTSVDETTKITNELKKDLKWLRSR